MAAYVEITKIFLSVYPKMSEGFPVVQNLQNLAR